MAQPGRSDLKFQWYACLPTEGVARVSPLRLVAGVEVLATEGHEVWLRGTSLGLRTHNTLRSVLGCRLYRPHGDGQLFPLGHTVPLGYEPQGTWTSLRLWLTTTLPKSRMAVRAVDSVPLSLVRSGNFQPAALLSVARSDWLAYASTAPLARLERLVFATSANRTVVMGHPLPPLPGEFYWIRHGIAAPVGMRWAPAIDAAVLGELFGLGEGDIALLLLNGGSSVIRSDQFVGATRSAVRLTEGTGHAAP